MTSYNWKLLNCTDCQGTGHKLERYDVADDTVALIGRFMLAEIKANPTGVRLTDCVCDRCLGHGNYWIRYGG